MARLLFILDIGFDRGGPSVHLLQDIIRAGLNDGHEIVTVLKKTGGPDAEMPDEFSENKNFSYYIIRETDEKKYGFIGRYLNEIKYAKKCSRFFLRQGCFDAAFLQSNTTAFFYLRLLKKLKCRVVFNVQDIFPYNLKLSGQLPFACITFRVFRKLQNLAYRAADCIITISDDMKQTLINDGVAADKIEVVYNWSYADTQISVESIAPDNFFNLELDHAKLNVVYAGNIGKMQNVEIVAKAAQILKEDESIHFCIVGDGANKKDIVKMVDGLQTVTLFPMQPARYAESIYAQADVNVIPLMPGGIKTALPSKTATCLRTKTLVLFCVDKENDLKNKFGENDKVRFVSAVSVNELVDELQRTAQIKRDNIAETETGMDRLQLFKTTNAKRYISNLTRRE